MKTQTEVRDSFWQFYPEFSDDFRVSYRQNQYKADIRMAFVDFVDQLHRANQISDKLAQRVTL